jgi:hypothetical protein
MASLVLKVLVHPLRITWLSTLLKRLLDSVDADWAASCYNWCMLQIPLPPDAEEALRERARAKGQDVGSYAARLIQEALSAPSVEELLAPFRRQVEESGLTDEELNQLGEELRDEVWRERQAQKAKSG